MRKYIKEEISDLSKTIKAEGPLVTIRKYILRYRMIVKFFVSGGLAAFTLLFSLFVLTDLLDIWYLLSSIAAFLLATIVSFSLHKFWTFKDKNKIEVRKQITFYFFLQTSLLVINTISIYLLVDLLNIWYLLAQFIVSLVLAIVSFVFYRFRIFTKSSYQTILQPLEKDEN